jgi:hypothetical protein
MFTSPLIPTSLRTKSMTIALQTRKMWKINAKNRLNSPFRDKTLAINAYDIEQLGATAFKVSNDHKKPSDVISQIKHIAKSHEIMSNISPIIAYYRAS